MIKTLAKSIITRFPSTANSVWRWYYLNFRYTDEQSRHVVADNTGERKEVFSKIFRNNTWKNEESVSGFGSTLYNTTLIRRELPKLIRKYNVETLLDAPCGDFNWMQHVTLPAGVSYIGCDIVPELIDGLNEKHAKPGRSFKSIDIVDGPIPDADMWLCRDVLFHLCFKDGLSCLENGARSNIRFFLSTSYDYVEVNNDIANGEFRFINLTKPPYALPQPLHQFSDYLVPDHPRIIGVWSREQLISRFQ